MINAAIKILKNFMIKMNHWEISYYNSLINSNFNINKDSYKNSLSEIFNEYCTTRLINLKRNRLNCIHVNYPPTYDIDYEEILDINLNDNKIVIYTKKNNAFENDFRYTMKLYKNQWLIDKKEYYDIDKSKWEHINL